MLIFKSKGFSQKITFLYLTPSSMSLICVDVVEAINTAFIFLSLNAIAGLSIGIDLSTFEILRVNFLLIS